MKQAFLLEGIFKTLKMFVVYFVWDFASDKNVMHHYLSNESELSTEMSKLSEHAKQIIITVLFIQKAKLITSASYHLIILGL